MELLVCVVLAIVAWMVWNGLKPPGATIRSSLERDRRRRGRGPGDGASLRLMLAAMPMTAAGLLDRHSIAATVIGL